MLRAMIEGWVLWLVLVGLAIGVTTAWLLLVRLPRDEEDVSAAERQVEAEWIAAIIERHGGVAPRSFVEEVLELHQAYLREARPPEPETPLSGSASPAAGPMLPNMASPPGHGAPRQVPTAYGAPRQVPTPPAPPGQVPPAPLAQGPPPPSEQAPSPPPGSRPPTSR